MAVTRTTFRVDMVHFEAEVVLVKVAVGDVVPFGQEEEDMLDGIRGKEKSTPKHSSFGSAALVGAAAVLIPVVTKRKAILKTQTKPISSIWQVVN